MLNDILKNGNKHSYNTHHMKSFFMDPTQDTDDFYNAYYDRENADWDAIYKNYSAAVDWPTCTFYKELMDKYPNAKVILTERTADSWYTSVKNTIQKAASHSEGDNEKMKKFKKMTSTVCSESNINDDEKFADEEAIKNSFIKHNEEVKAYVPKERLLIMQLGEGWDRLCEFLGKDVPETPYPRSNSTEDFNTKSVEMAKKAAQAPL